MKTMPIGRAVRATLLSSAALLASSFAVSAQQAQTAQNANVEEIIVTGSRIPVTSLTSENPVSITSSAQFQMTPSFNMEDVLTKMVGPDTTGGTTANSNNGGTGTSQIGLRNLGPSRTLVLIDGQRLVPVFGSTFSAPDLNAVPLAMTERVEVLRDGASSIYGADAIGGVINIITKKDFSGLQFDVEGGMSQHGGGNSYSASATYGNNFDKGNITISASNERQGAIGQWQRAWSNDPHANDPNFPFGSTYRSQMNVLQDTDSPGSSVLWVGGKLSSTKDPNLGALVPCVAYSSVAGRNKLNSGCGDLPQGGWNYLTGSLERTQFSGSAHYDFSDEITGILQGTFTQRISQQALRPEPLLGTQIGSVNFTDGGTIFPGFMVPANTHWGYPGGGVPQPCATQAGTLTGGCIIANLTPDQFGPRTYHQLSDTDRFRAGLEGNLFGKWKWEAGFVAQRNDTTQLIYNSGQFQHLMQMTGLAPCVDVPGGCTSGTPYGLPYAVPAVPTNFFAGPDMMTPAQLSYLTYTNEDRFWSDQNYIYADINGALFDLPAGPLQAAVGFEHRTEHFTYHPDTLETEGFAANHTLGSAGGYRTNSEYAELRIPLLKGQPFADELTVTPSVRHDDNSQFGTATTWKVGGNYQAVEQFRIRGSYATGFRAPSLSELYNANAISFVSVDGDPCDSRGVINGNTNMGKASLASGSTCYAALSKLGLSAAQIAAYQSPENNLASDQRGFVLGGNPALQAEKSRSWTAGAVVQPIPGLTASFDYYFIKVMNSIADGGIALSGSPDFVPLGCYVQQIQSFCNLIVRNGSGIFQVSSQNTNFGVTHVRGIDLELAYTTKFEDIGINMAGSFTIDVKAEHEITNDQSNPDGTVTNYVGFFNYGNESIQPSWKGTLNVDYNNGPLGLHWDTQFIKGMEDLGGVNHVYGDYTPDMWYHNLSVSYNVADLLHMELIQHANVILGVNNLFDKDPPFLALDSICKCNSLAGPYDFVGRFFYTRLQVKF
jgi:outer membrane receptor protein involved in Fe transport